MQTNLYGWGKSVKYKSNIFEPKNLKQLLKTSNKKLLIARGYGRSYGDSSVQKKCTVITKKLKNIIFFDYEKGIIEAEAGINIRDLLKVTLKKNWILPIIPGSKFISLGGMVASDVHGKNHHIEGSFRDHILELKIIYDNSVINCSKKKFKELFNYTVGGMGLTGIIYSCKFKLKKINSNYIYQETIKTLNLKDTLNLINKSFNWNYNVAWLDTSADNSCLGRGILFRGNHIKKKTSTLETEFLYKRKVKLLFNFPLWFMNKYLINFLNSLYYFFNKLNKKKVDLDSFFFQLDKLHSWNLIYGKKGFISYQCSFPKRNAYKGIKEFLGILKEKKVYSFVSVIKSLGKNSEYLSFGKKGYTIVFDFPKYKNINSVLEILDSIVIKFNGDIYLVKDSRIRKNRFNKTNHKFNNKIFKQLRHKYGKRFHSSQSLRLNI